MERIVSQPGIRSGRPIINGTRITVTEVLEMFSAGMSEADIIESFPKLTPEDIRAALNYAARSFDHPVVTSP
jgi:uncharacterized protein (DUF433 family)